ncbi:hypothetical protein JN12_02527 [Geobacter argillaceus]|uniref:Uncharacterized protein n=1 Tax=Geobacter argillaceus TaxID=345631 RepID=A0A562VLU6_9BACT|nr:hypothetical protein JN12_02527 [Geobacter argillaceus]
MTGCACGQMYCNGCMDGKAVADNKSPILPGRQVSEGSTEEDPKGSQA